MGQLARKKQLTFLERRSISLAVEGQYKEYYKKFVNFCQESKLPNPPHQQTDSHMADFMDILFMEGKTVSEGEKILASVEFRHIELKGNMLRSRKALKGWRKERPQESRLPIPALVVNGIAMILLHQNQRLMGLKVLLDFDTYMRPGESIDIRARQVVPPVVGAGPQYLWYHVVIREFQEGRPDKIGVFDNSVALDHPQRSWLGEVLFGHSKTVNSKDDFLFQFKMEEYRHAFSMAGESLGISGLHPYQLRHGGAAEDLNSKTREYSSVKARGRWMTDQSVRRYTKVGKLQALMTQLSPANLEYCRWCQRNMEKVIRGLIPPKGP